MMIYFVKTRWPEFDEFVELEKKDDSYFEEVAEFSVLYNENGLVVNGVSFNLEDATVISKAITHRVAKEIKHTFIVSINNHKIIFKYEDDKYLIEFWDNDALLYSSGEVGDFDFYGVRFEQVSRNKFQFETKRVFNQSLDFFDKAFHDLFSLAALY